MKISKVIHVTRRFNADKWGGTEAVVWNLAKQFQARGIKSPVYTSSMFAQTGNEDIHGVDVRRFDYCFPFFNLDKQQKQQMMLKGGNALSLSLLRALKKEHDCSIIHTHVMHRMGGIARTAARKLGIPYVVSLHGGELTLTSEEKENLQKPFKNKIEWGKAFGWWLGSRRLLIDADGIICVGQSEYEKMKLKYPQKKVIYQPNGVDIDSFAHADPKVFFERFKLSADEKIVLCVSRLDPQKNQLLLLRAFAGCPRLNDYKLCLIGSSSNDHYFNALKNEITRLAIGHRVLLINGLQAHDKALQAAYKAADFFILPSIHEPFGIVILEAWAAGLPVVASRVGGIPGFTEDGRNILHFNSNDESALIKAMENLLQDEALKKRLADQGRTEVRRYSWQQIAREHLSFYESLTS